MTRIFFCAILLAHLTNTIVGQELNVPPINLPPALPDYFCGQSESGNSWSYLGPTDQLHDLDTDPLIETLVPYQGIVITAAYHPTNPSILFTAGNTSGLFKSINGGTTWYNVTDNLNISGLGITDIEFNPVNPDIMYATTGQKSNKYGNYSIGIMKSINGGESWTYNNNLGEQIDFAGTSESTLRCLTINPQNGDEIIAGGFKKIYRSNDAGMTWEVHNFDNSINQNESFIVGNVEFDLLNSDVIYASTISSISAYARFWVSEDHGLTWNIRTPPTDPLEVVMFDVTNAAVGSVFCAVVKSTSLIDVYRSDTQGVTWQLIQGNVTSGSSGNAINFYKHEFQVSELSDQIIFHSGARMYIMFNNGTQWIKEGIHSGLHDDIRDIRMYSWQPGVENILLGTDGGVQSTNIAIADLLAGSLLPSAIGWDEKNGVGLQLTQIYGLGDYDRYNGFIYGAQDLGVWKNMDGNTSSVFSNADGRFTSSNSFFNSVSAYGSQLGFSVNSISISALPSFTNNLGNFPYTTFGGDWRNLTARHQFNPKDNRELISHGYQIYKWTFNGTSSFVSQPSALPNVPNPDPNDNGLLPLSAFAFAPSDNNIRYCAFVGTYGNSVNAILNPEEPLLPNPELVVNGQLRYRLLKSTNGGVSYDEDLTNTLYYTQANGTVRHVYEWGAISYLMVDPNNSNRVYAALAGFASDDIPERVIVSDDGGLTWANMSQGLSRYPINQLLYQEGSDEVIYAATDAGVYRWNTSIDEWECFNNGLPPCIVTSMDIEQCDNTMTIATYGRGIWKIELPAITNDVTYTSDYTIDQYEVLAPQNDIVVEDGATLTVFGHVYLKPEKSIIVKPGGHLIMEGALLSNGCPGVLAQGIVVEGNPTIPQIPYGNQGWVELREGTVVENMHHGVLCAGLQLASNSECESDYSKTGGIVFARGAQFKNCYIGAEIAYYQDYMAQPLGWPRSNISNFRNCDFITDRELDLSTFEAGFTPSPKAGIMLKDVWKVKIFGCRFNNLSVDDPQTTFTNQHKWGKGIWATNGSFQVKDLCDDLTCANPIHCEFTNLEFGIKAQSSDFISTFELRNAVFTGNYCGVSSEGSLVGPFIRGNTFMVNDLPYNSDGTEVVGLNLDQTSGFHVQENYFESLSQEPGPMVIGIALEHTTNFGAAPEDVQEAASNIIRRNWFDGLDIGINAEGPNAIGDINNPQESYGLEFRCNKFGQISNNCERAFSLFSDTQVQQTQGEFNQNKNAGNIFLNDFCAGDNQWEHWDNDASSAIANYYFGSNFELIFTKPVCTQLDYSNPTEGTGAYVENITCSEEPYGVGVSNKPSPQIKEEHMVKKNALVETQDIFHGLLDGGDMLYLKSLILNPLSESASIRNELLQISPNISDEIWQSCFDRNPAMNPWHLTQVLLAASPLRSSVMDMLKVSNLAQTFKDMVTNGQFEGITSKEIFESDLAGLAQDAATLRQDLLRSYLLTEDHELSESTTVLDDFFEDNGTISDLYLRAGLKLKLNDFAGTQQVLTGGSSIIPTKYHYRPLAIVLESKQIGQYPNFSPVHLQELESLAADEHQIGAAQARAVLAMVKEETYPIDIDTRQLSLRSSRVKLEHKPESIFSVQPNPANEHLWITYPAIDEDTPILLTATDMMGRVILSQQYNSPKGLIELNTSQWDTGLFILEFRLGESILGTEKIEIIR